MENKAFGEIWHIRINHKNKVVKKAKAAGAPGHENIISIKIRRRQKYFL